MIGESVQTINSQPVARVLLLCADVRTIPLAEKLMSLKAMNYSLYICLCIFVFLFIARIICIAYLYALRSWRK